MDASREGHVEAVAMLIGAKAKLDLQNKVCHNTVVKHAIYFYH
jgi:hypothetical protein